MSSAAHAIAVYLDGLSIATFRTSTGWRLSIGNEPTEPPNCVTVYDTGGEGWDTDQLDITTDTVQVRIRAVNYIDACEKCNEIEQALKRATFVHEGKNYFSIRQMGGKNHIGFNDQNRTLVTLNFDCLSQETT